MSPLSIDSQIAYRDPQIRHMRTVRVYVGEIIPCTPRQALKTERYMDIDGNQGVKVSIQGKRAVAATCVL